MLAVVLAAALPTTSAFAQRGAPSPDHEEMVARLGITEQLRPGPPVRT